MNPAHIKPVLILLTALFILLMLSGCVVAPYAEPVVVSPPPARAVVLRPAHRPYHPHYGQHLRRWR